MAQKSGILSVQYESRINNREKNFETVSEIINSFRNEKLDLILLPEFFSTGISHSGFLELAEEEGFSFTIEYFSKIAKKYDTNICLGTIIENDGDKKYNTSYILNRSGKVVSKYRKIHLFSYLGGNEDSIITKGDKVVVSELDFAKVGMGICFDIRFPLHFNKLIKMGAEIIVCPNAWCTPSNFPDSIRNIKTNEMLSFAISRASENLVYFVTSSLYGKLGSGLVSSGKTTIVSPFGEVLNEAKGDKTAIYQEIDLSVVRKLKTEFPVYKLD